MARVFRRRDCSAIRSLQPFYFIQRPFKQQTEMKLYTEEQVINTVEAIKDYLKNYPEKFHESMIKKHLMNLAPVTTKRTLIIYNTKETTEEEASHLLEILNCDDSTLWDNADHCGVQVIEVPLENGGGEQ
jgi:methylmalonyl-CoA mutase N-terminal domain/subunit